MIDAELHTRARFSPDSLNRLSDVIRACRAVSVHRIAITDHKGESALHARACARPCLGPDVSDT